MEKPHIRKYTEDSYEWLNEELRRNNGVAVKPAIQKACQDLCDELLSIPDYQEIVYRGAKIRQQDLDKYIKAYQEDTTIKEPNFISTSCSILTANEFMNISFGTIKAFFEIVSKTGKLIASYSKHPWEKEVLFLPNTNFRVLSIEYHKEKISIKLLEV